MSKDELNERIAVYTSNQAYKVEIVKALLQENNIVFVEVNKKDAAYGFIGEIELHVHTKDEIFSKLIIEQNNL
jgi:hypothetical protein